MSTTFGIANEQLAATPLPDGYDHASTYLRAFVLNSRLALRANEAHRRRLLLAAVHEVVAQAVNESVEAIAQRVSASLVEELLGTDIGDALNTDFQRLYGDDGELIDPEDGTGFLSDDDLASLH